ncbi:hypothetical protein ACHWQZ_G008708 [Mnemiopsis leidyi]
MASVQNSVNDDAKKEVIGSLLSKADPPSKKVLSSYDFNASYKANLEKLKAHNASALEACASFLGFTVRENEKKLYRNQKILCDRLILKIESLFDIECNECSETYRNELTDKPLFRCQLCLQGSHNCTEMARKAEALQDLQNKGLLPPGTSWLCYECLKKNNLALLPPTKPTKDRNTDSLSVLAPIKEEDNQEDIDVEDGGEDRESPIRGRNEEQNTKHNKICPLYVQRKCPHGLTGKRLIKNRPCPNQHPKKCRFYSNFGNDKQRGCKNGKECNFFHPKLCKDSVTRRCCLNKNCTYHHLKGTARKVVNPEAAENLLAEQQYRGQLPQGRHRDSIQDTRNWPPLRRAVSEQELQKMSSLQSLYTPYPPTVSKTKATHNRRESTSEKDKAFLEKLMENLKDGIISQMDTKISELQSQIPALVQEAQWNQQTQRSRQDSHQSLCPQQISRTQLAQAVPLNAQPHPMSMQMPMNFLPNFQGSYY